MYTIVDLETTGFSPSRGDKIIEVGAVKVNEKNNIVDKFSTLINPMRDISNYHIHGIEPHLVKNAPKFVEVAPYFKLFLEGSTIVAHNANFDLRFLNYQLFDNTASGICTLKLSSQVEPSLPNRRLITLCNYFDIKIGASHEALSDALATSKLFSILRKSYIQQYGHSQFKKEFDSPLNCHQSLSNGFQKIEYKRNKAQTEHQKEKHKIDQFLNRLPTENFSDNKLEKLEYLDILSNVLADRILSDDEVQTLHELAEEFDFSKKDVLDLHKQYLREVIQVYLIDDVVSTFERSDLENLTCLLGISELDKLIDSERQTFSKLFQSTEKQPDLTGQKICFTGKLKAKIGGEQVSRSQAQKLAHQKGMIIKKNISKKVDYLIAAKPNSMSGKAKKARKYNIPIIAEPEFWKLIGINVE